MTFHSPNNTDDEEIEKICLSIASCDEVNCDYIEEEDEEESDQAGEEEESDQAGEEEFEIPETDAEFDELEGIKAEECCFGGDVPSEQSESEGEEEEDADDFISRRRHCQFIDDEAEESECSDEGQEYSDQDENLKCELDAEGYISRNSTPYDTYIQKPEESPIISAELNAPEAMIPKSDPELEVEVANKTVVGMASQENNLSGSPSSSSLSPSASSSSVSEQVTSDINCMADYVIRTEPSLGQRLSNGGGLELMMSDGSSNFGGPSSPAASSEELSVASVTREFANIPRNRWSPLLNSVGLTSENSECLPRRARRRLRSGDESEVYCIEESDNEAVTVGSPSSLRIVDSAAVGGLDTEEGFKAAKYTLFGSDSDIETHRPPGRQFEVDPAPIKCSASESLMAEAGTQTETCIQACEEVKYPSELKEGASRHHVYVLLESVGMDGNEVEFRPSEKWRSRDERELEWEVHHVTGRKNYLVFHGESVAKKQIGDIGIGKEYVSRMVVVPAPPGAIETKKHRVVAPPQQPKLVSAGMSQKTRRWRRLKWSSREVVMRAARAAGAAYIRD